jgi:hypothetical protein
MMNFLTDKMKSCFFIIIDDISNTAQAGVHYLQQSTRLGVIQVRVSIGFVLVLIVTESET